MEKVISFLAALMLTFSAFAFDVNSTFGMKRQDTPEEYQQYVGKRFQFRYPCGVLETWDNSGFKLKDRYIPNTYTITKIKVKDVVLNGKPNKEITVKAIQNGIKKKVQFKGYEELSVKADLMGNIKQWPLIGYMPIVFTEPLNEFKSQNVGKILTHPMVKDSYEVTDAYVSRGDSLDATATLGLEVRNTRTGVTKKVLYSEKDTDPFADALEGIYSTALVKVERPGDDSDRYSEVRTITDDGVDKYSFSDSIISILILGTREQFNFVLKNVSPHSIKVIWNEAAFVDLDGTTSKIMHTGVKYSEKDGAQPVTTVIRDAKINDFALPTANVYYDEGIRIGEFTFANGWKTNPMLPTDHIGKEPGEIRLMLPIQVKDVVNEYTFVFKVYYIYDHPELLNQEYF